MGLVKTTTFDRTSTARRECAKRSSMADVTATKTTSNRSRNVKRHAAGHSSGGAGVHRSADNRYAIDTASSVSDMTNTVVNSAAV